MPGKSQRAAQPAQEVKVKVVAEPSKQSRRSRRQQSAPTATKTPPVHVAQGRRTHRNVVAAVPKLSAPMNGITLLARARALPELTAPQRMPYLSRQQSDVKKLFIPASITTEKPAGVTAEVVSILGTATLLPSQHAAFIGRSPVAPMVYQLSNGAMTAGSGWAALWADTDFPWHGNRPVTDFIINSNVLIHSGGGEAVYTPPGTAGNFGPSHVVGLVDNSTTSSTYIGTYTLTAGLVPPPSEVLTTPTIYSKRTGFTYGLMYAPNFRLYLTTLNGQAAPANATFYFSLIRYNGDDSEQTVCTLAPLVASGQKEVFQDVLPSSVGLTAPLCGYFRLRLDYARLAPNATTQVQHPIYVCRVAVLGESKVDKFWVQPAVEAFNDANYLFRKVRITACSMRVSNRTPGMFRGGNIYAARLDSVSTPTSPCGAGWYNCTPSSIRTDSCVNRIGYNGDATFGAYTWMELDKDDEEFQDCTAEYTLRTDLTVAKLNLDHFCRLNHGVLIDMSNISESNSAFSGFLRCDYHIEYVSSSPLANNTVTVITSEELAQANTLLALAPLAYENPKHLATIWSTIRKFAWPVLKAAGSAAARAGLEAAMAAL